MPLLGRLMPRILETRTPRCGSRLPTDDVGNFGAARGHTDVNTVLCSKASVEVTCIVIQEQGIDRLVTKPRCAMVDYVSMNAACYLSDESL
ncbi:hypothetical protein KC365_g88 [Hortaea werneckii]|nr:hypothetical protein KC365_g88 [Hortaea werneckii]